MEYICFIFIGTGHGYGRLQQVMAGLVGLEVLQKTWLGNLLMKVLRGEALKKVLHFGLGLCTTAECCCKMRRPMSAGICEIRRYFMLGLMEYLSPIHMPLIRFQAA